MFVSRLSFCSLPFTDFTALTICKNRSFTNEEDPGRGLDIGSLFLIASQGEISSRDSF